MFYWEDSDAGDDRYLLRLMWDHEASLSLKEEAGKLGAEVD